MNALYRRIFERIDQFLVYPAEFKAAKISGSITAHLVFSRDGIYLRPQSRFDATSNYLKVEVLRALRKAFAEALPAELMKGVESRQLEVSCYFLFAITEGNEASARDEREWMSAGHLSFYRNYHHSVLQWELGPLSGLGPMPVGLDPSWFVRKIQEATTNKAKIDPLERWRNDPEW
jgi:hypothetical protein